MTKPKAEPKTRRLEDTWAPGDSGPNGILIYEYTSYLPTGHTRRKWQRDSVYVTLDELRQLAKKYL
jgi:hypothetical protein